MKKRRLIPDSQVRHRYGGICGMTIRRWEKNPNLGFPPAILINGRKYRDEAELDAFDAARPRKQESAAA